MHPKEENTWRYPRVLKKATEDRVYNHFEERSTLQANIGNFTAKQHLANISHCQTGQYSGFSIHVRRERGVFTSAQAERH